MKRICVTNRLLCQEDFLSRVQKIAAAGADAILLREKDLSETQYAILAKQVQEICLLYNVSLLLNSFWQTAATMHLPVQLPMPQFQKLSSADRQEIPAVGVSVHSIAEAHYAQSHHADWLIAGHIFPTACKPDLPPRGIPFLQQICDAVSIPVYAIGGITAEQQECIQAAGASGCCVMSQWMTCANPQTELQKWRNFS